MINADDVNLRMLAPPRRITMRYEDLTAADDGNQDKAAISDASDLPWDLSRCVTNTVETFYEKTTSPRKRSRNGYVSEASNEHEADKGNGR